MRDKESAVTPGIPERNRIARPTSLGSPCNRVRGEINLLRVMVVKSVCPTISVVIPAYGCANSIGAALESVFSQTFREFEVIVINDGSPDTPQLERALIPYQTRIEYIRQKNAGPSSARNRGIRQARGKYVAFLDSDDFWFPRHLENQMSLLLGDRSLDLVYANLLVLRGNTPVGAGFDLFPQVPPVTLDALLREECKIGTSSVVASRQSLMTAGLFDESMRRCEDFDLWLRMANCGAHMSFSPEIQLGHRSGNGLSSDSMLMKRARILVYEKLSRQMQLTPHQRQLLNRKIAVDEAEYQIDLAKSSLLEQNYAQALSAARKATGTAPSWKLHVAVRGLQAAPNLLLHSYRAYSQVLEARNRNRIARRMKGLEVYADLASHAITSG